jgi:hypothetical protein
MEDYDMGDDEAMEADDITSNDKYLYWEFLMDDLIEKWHTSNLGISLSKYLGMTDEEYGVFCINSHKYYIDFVNTSSF